jgi:hypothetical protein
MMEYYLKISVKKQQMYLRDSVDKGIVQKYVSRCGIIFSIDFGNIDPLQLFTVYISVVSFKIRKSGLFLSKPK